MSKKSKRKNNLKSSVILLLLLLLLLISSTYAWFTANQLVTISTLDVKIEAKNGLQISTDAVNWKSIISNDDITTNAYTGNKNQVPDALEPVSTVGEIDETTGYMKMYYGTVKSNEVTGLDELTASATTDTSGQYIVFDIFLKVEKETQLQLTADSGVVAKGTDNGIKQASRIAFCEEGNQPTGTAATDITGLKGATDGSVYIWEPNSNVHTAAAIAHANSNYKQTINANTKVEYYGIKSPITTGVTLDNTYVENEYFSKVTPKYQTDERMEVTDVFTLQAGITKFRVYMWIEGQDFDCENTASGTDISFNVQLQVKA